MNSPRQPPRIGCWKKVRVFRTFHSPKSDSERSDNKLQHNATCKARRWWQCWPRWWSVVVCGGVWWCGVVWGGICWCGVAWGGVWWCVVVPGPGRATAPLAVSCLLACFSLSLSLSLSLSPGHGDVSPSPGLLAHPIILIRRGE